MDVLKISGAVILTVVLTQILKTRDNNFATLATTLTLIITGVYIISSLRPLIDFSMELIAYVKNGTEILTLLIKATGIVLLTHFISDVCENHGEKTLASIVDFTADSAILLLVLPFIKRIFQTMIELSNNIKR